MTDPISVTVDGLPSWQADVNVAASDRASDLHLNNGISGISDIVFDRPSRLIAIEDRAPGRGHLGGQHLLIVLWAVDDATYAAWLPVAEQIVDSIRFNPR